MFLEMRGSSRLSLPMRYAFTDCVLDTASQTLSRSDEIISIEPQVYDLLLLLVSNAGKLITWDEIVDTVWNGRAISDSAISARVAAARKAVGDDGKAQAVIQTIPRRGLRLHVDVAHHQDGKGDGTALTEGPPPLRYARAEDGTRLAYTVTGNGPPVMYFDFFPGDTLGAWDVATERPLIDKMDANFTVLRYDQRGCGMSELDIEGFELETLADDARAVADAAGFESFGISSLSGACLTALTFAARHPKRINRMVLAGAYMEGRLRRRGQNDDTTEMFRTMLNEGWEEPSNAFVTAFMTAYMPEGPADMVRDCAAFMQKNAPQKNVLLDRDMINSASVESLLKLITAPTLLIHARHDSVHPLNQAQKLAAGLNNAELLVYESSNHVPIPGHRLWEQYLGDMIGFLSGE